MQSGRTRKPSSILRRGPEVSIWEVKSCDAACVGFQVCAAIHSSSRSLVKNLGGDLVYEHRDHGCCFAVVLEKVTHTEETNDDC